MMALNGPIDTRIMPLTSSASFFVQVIAVTQSAFSPSKKKKKKILDSTSLGNRLAHRPSLICEGIK